MVYIDKDYLAAAFPAAANPADESVSNEQINDAFKQIDRLVKVRDRSVCEIERRLAQRDIPQKIIDAAIARALRCGYLDDTRFADVLIRSRLRSGKGLPGVVRELKKHQIDPDSLPGFPNEYLDEAPNQDDAAYALLCRKPPRAKNKRQAAYAKLMRAGYSSAVALNAVRKWEETLQSQELI